MLVQPDSRRLQASADATNPFHLIPVAFALIKVIRNGEASPRARLAAAQPSPEILKLPD
jgi:hypothetical protein